MSSQKGNTARTRAQKHKNTRAFKNDLYDKTPKVKLMNGLSIQNVCDRCKSILEWKIKYKKYKPLTAPKTCTKCQEKKIKNAYHILCQACASLAHVCPRCGKESVPFEDQSVTENSLESNKELQELIKTLPERKRRTLLRHLAKGKGEDSQSPDGVKISELIAKFKANLEFDEDDDQFSSGCDSGTESSSHCSDVDEPDKD